MVRFVLSIFLTFNLLGCASSSIEIPSTISLSSNHAEKAIVFIHGLNGHPEESWKNPETNEVWTKLLAKDIDISKEFRIFSLSYNAGLLNGNMTLKEMGQSLRADIKNIGLASGKQFKEVYFIAHSMGNLALRSLMAEEPDFFSEVKIPLIISMGSPSNGSDLAAIGKLFFPNNSALSNLTSSNNSYLTEINNKWRESQGDTRISCGYEKLPTSAIGFVVPQDSATAVCNGSLWPVSANHVFMVKPRNTQDRIYVWTKDEILSTSHSPKLQALVRFQNAFSQSSSKAVTQSQPKKADNPPRAATNTVSLSDVKDAVAGMLYDQIPAFLYKTVPQIKDGIDCNDLALLASKAVYSEAGNIVVNLAKYVRRPLSEGCMRKISSTVLYTDQSRAAQALLLSSQ